MKALYELLLTALLCALMKNDAGEITWLIQTVGLTTLALGSTILVFESLEMTHDLPLYTDLIASRNRVGYPFLGHKKSSKMS